LFNPSVDDFQSSYDEFRQKLAKENEEHQKYLEQFEGFDTKY